MTHDIEKFFRMLLKRNGYVLEQLFSPLVVTGHPLLERVKSAAAKCITRHHVHHYLGFAATQWGLFEKESPPRVKPLLYVYRVLLTGIHLMRTGEVEANLVVLNAERRLSFLPELIARKAGGCEHELLGDSEKQFHAGEFARLRAELESAAATSALPELPGGADELNEILVDVRLGR